MKTVVSIVSDRMCGEMLVDDGGALAMVIYVIEVQILEIEGPCCKEMTSEGLELKVLKFLGKTKRWWFGRIRRGVQTLQASS